MKKDLQFWLTAILSSLTMATVMSGLISGYKMGFSADWRQFGYKASPSLGLAPCY